VTRAGDIATSALASVVRLGAGSSARFAARRPEKLVELYDFEACPYCRRVREALSEFDIDALIFPCPKGGTRFRPRVAALGGKQQYPYLVDPNTGSQLYESADIVDYLRRTYQAPSAPLWMGPLSLASSEMATRVRRQRGRTARPARAPEKPLELWGFEACTFCRIVRETLCELELPYVQHNVARGSPRRKAFVARSGRMMVPYLLDPNTGREMFESADIVTYLEKTYGIEPTYGMSGAP
jgi:glutathione S-transferase